MRSSDCMFYTGQFTAWANINVTTIRWEQADLHNQSDDEVEEKRREKGIVPNNNYHGERLRLLENNDWKSETDFSGSATEWRVQMIRMPSFEIAGLQKICLCCSTFQAEKM